MIHLMNDYSDGAHPAVMEALLRTNAEKTPGYGLDGYSAGTAGLIRELCGAAGSAGVHFLTGGTVTNSLLISALLRPWQAVIAADCAHINTHETGAVESRGNKILTARTPDGKLTPELITEILDAHSTEHMVEPRLVYISDLNELGMSYTLPELEDISETCRSHGLLLFLDGARLGCAMVSEPGAGFRDFHALCDAFYIGGTKNGLLFGEALVIKDPAMDAGFRHMMKRHGAMLAKGRLIAVQFEALLSGGLFLELASMAVGAMDRIRALLAGAGVALATPARGNMAFPVIGSELRNRLDGKVEYETGSPDGNGESVARLVSSWSTTDEEIAGFGELLGQGA